MASRLAPKLVSTFSRQELDDFLAGSSADLWVGVSGGVDSVVLLHLILSTYFLPNHDKKSSYPLERLKVIHIHHGLSPNADDWQEFCANLCQQWQIYFENHRVFVSQEKASLEEAARDARYKVFERKLKQDDVLLLAHHANDQAETLLFRLLRGTGIKGMTGIPKQRCLGEGCVIRPLLSCSKKEILEYAKSHSLTWVEDESNGDIKYSRNFIRHRLVPTLQKYKPQAVEVLSSVAERAAFDYKMLSSLASEKLEEYKAADGSLYLEKLATFTAQEKCFWLQHYLQVFSISLTQPQLVELEKAMFSSLDRQPCMSIPAGRLMRFQQRLYLLPDDMPVEIKPLSINSNIERQVDIISLKLLVDDADINQAGFTLETRPEGAVIVLANGHARKLKKWLNDQNIPSWWRDHLPYLFYKGQLVAIGSLWISSDFQDVIEVSWTRKDVLPWPTSVS